MAPHPIRRLRRQTARAWLGLGVVRRYNYVVGSQPSFVYFRVAKVATRSTVQWLRAELPDRLEWHNSARLPRHWESTTSVAMVRNPWDRLVSCWIDKVRDYEARTSVLPDFDGLRGMDFPAFVDTLSHWNLRGADRHVRPQVFLVPPDTQYVGRLERLDEFVGEVAERLAIDPSSYPHRGQRPRADRGTYLDYYDDRTAALVGEMYRDDCLRWGYRFGDE